jgi:hypothetical protein
MRFPAAQPRKTCDSVPLGLLLPPAAPPSLALLTRQTEIFLVFPDDTHIERNVAELEIVGLATMAGAGSGLLESPNPLHAVCVKLRISTDDRDVLRNRLGDQQSVERVFVILRESQTNQPGSMIGPNG